MITKPTISFLGLGVMGAPMAGHLAAAGHRVTVYNRTTSKAADWCEQHRQFDVHYETSPYTAVKQADIVMLCVGNDHDVRELLCGHIDQKGALDGMSVNTIVCDHTTASAELAREMYAITRSKGIHFIDAPVSGGQIGAINGQLTIMCGGEPDVFNRVEPILAIYAQAVTLMGPSGAGQLTKMVNQICVAGLLQGLSEAINFGQLAGLDMDKALAVISKGAASSWQLENRGPTMLKQQFDFGFAVDWMRKDLSLIFEEAQRINAPLPVTQIIDGYYQHIQANGGHRSDTSSLITLLKPS